MIRASKITWNLLERKLLKENEFVYLLVIIVIVIVIINI